MREREERAREATEAAGQLMSHLEQLKREIRSSLDGMRDRFSQLQVCAGAVYELGVNKGDIVELAVSGGGSGLVSQLLNKGAQAGLPPELLRTLG